MKKSILSIALASSACVLLALTPSCKGNNAEANNDTFSAEEMADAIATSAPIISDSLAAKYDKAFFDNAALKADTPSDSTWMQTKSGLKYTVVKEGAGVQPSASDAVTVHYIGRLLDGTVFDSSVSRGEPTTFPLSSVIPGWTEGLQYMKEGGVTIFYIPSDIAYGEKGGGPIPPNSDLIFDVQLISVQSAGM